jgi:molybdopterin-guanine dinucleotide biosynthesis protein A
MRAMAGIITVPEPFRDKAYPPLNEPRVTAVIPAYNEARCIAACIKSLLAQDIGRIEIIVADDGSSDGTADLAASLGARVVRCAHGGPGAARNAGVREARGNIIVLVDADMTFVPDYVSKLVSPIVKDGALASYHWDELVSNWENPWARCETWYLGMQDRRRQPVEMPERQYVYRAVRRDFFLDSGGFAEDWGRSDDGSIATRTGVFAVPAPGATCFHTNASGPAEVLGDAVWRGKTMIALKERSSKVLMSFLWHHNPLPAFLRGLRLAAAKGEPRLALYSVIFSTGMLSGIILGLLTGRYHK